MEIIFRLIELLVNTLLENNKPKQSPRPPVQPRAQVPPAYRSQTGAPPLLPRVTPASIDPDYDGEGWRRALTVLAVILFIVMVGVWFLYMQGWLQAPG